MPWQVRPRRGEWSDISDEKARELFIEDAKASYFKYDPLKAMADVKWSSYSFSLESQMDIRWVP
jgi:hypothetical protein